MVEVRVNEPDGRGGGWGMSAHNRLKDHVQVICDASEPPGGGQRGRGGVGGGRGGSGERTE